MEESVAAVKLLIRVLGNLLEVQYRVSLLRLLVFNAFGEQLADVEVRLDIRSIFLDDVLEVSEGLLVLAVVIPGQASLHVALLEQVLVIRLRLLLIQ